MRKKGPTPKSKKKGKLVKVKKPSGRMAKPAAHAYMKTLSHMKTTKLGPKKK